MSGRHRRDESDTERTWLEFSDLPPRPDPETGEPFPPHGLAYTGPEYPTNQSSPTSSRFFGTPKPPPGMGPPIAWHYDDISGNIVGYLVALAINVAGAMIISLLNGDNAVTILTHWQIWLIILVGAYLMSSPLDFNMMTAGADWLQWGRRKRWYQRRAHQGHIKIYDLVEITGESSGANAPYLMLEDTEGNVLYRMRHDLQKDRRIWDLLYNGILHSVAGGAKTNSLAIQLLELDNTPATKPREQGQAGD